MDGTTDIVRDLFGIPDCELVGTREVFEHGKRGREITLRYSGPVPDACHDCGGRMYSHGWRELKAIDTPAGGIPVRLVVRYPRRRCRECKALWQPEVVGVNEQRNMTDRAYIDITKRSLRNTFREVSRDYMLSHVTIKNVFEDFMREYEQRLRFRTPAFLGIDEIKIKKVGEVTVITDIEHRTVYDMLLGRNQTRLTEYFSKLPDADKVLWVCSDMYRPFERSISDALPNARWAIDHFHLVKMANEAIDTIRRWMQADMPKAKRVQTKRGLAYTLKTRARDLRPDEACKIRLLREDEDMRPLAVAFDLKEDFFDIYDENPASKESAQEAFERWSGSIPDDAIYEPFRLLAGTVRNFHTQIFQYWDCPIAITNGYTECANRLIRESNMRGRGYSFEVLRARTLYRQSNLEAILEGGGLAIGPSILSETRLFTTEADREETESEEAEADDGWGQEPGEDGSGSFVDLVTGRRFDPETRELIS
jgi:transposase